MSWLILFLETIAVNNYPCKPLVHFWLHHTALVRGFWISRKGGTGGGGWGCLQRYMHMVAARLGCERAMVGIRRATPRPDCMDRLRTCYSLLVEVSGREVSLGSEQVFDNWECWLLHEWAWSRSWVCLLKLEVDMGSVLESELVQKQRYGALRHVWVKSSLKWNNWEFI